MKNLLLVLVAITLFSTQALAVFNIQPGDSVLCENLTGNNINDTYISIEMDSSGISVNPWESSLQFYDSNFSEAINTVVAPDQSVMMTGEGEVWHVSAQAVFVYNPSKKTLVATVMVDGQTLYGVNGTTFKCK